MPIDLGLAKELGCKRSGACCHTGTMEFMAIEVLLGISHAYHHDLESFFYVLIWQCARRSWEFLNKLGANLRASYAPGIPAATKTLRMLNLVP